MDHEWKHSRTREDVILIVPDRPHLSARFTAARFNAPDALEGLVESGEIILLQGLDKRFTIFCNN